MTGYTVHTGSNDKFRDGWDQVFSSKAPPRARRKKTKDKTVNKKAPAKKAAKGKK